ncbi:arginine--tRNA ligase [Streptomyces drozdowiczii]|uniref:Arginine--tRNA ligase n=1 Tax=Streptomyces drozdowiczii TaxID=202862 RepID=A0ABY6PU33_9ACTN|nr:arginine--tRNA ligase [Streptomyces drozdowiczii]MCX0244415.1 arginine--tRNA ligase [Streptomyces drozdowiczii]UZK55807.1 arginine--tRNA ligase [Streptomyces drozdowiczii]
MANLEELLHQRLAPAFEAVAGAPVDPVIRRSQHAHFQSDAALALVRKIGGNPREIAARVVEAAQLDDLCSAVEISGPGFINLTFSDEVLARLLADTIGDERLAVPQAKDSEKIVVDYSAPNAAKEMHVGHLRSTIIGDAAVRLLEWQGNTVIRMNHIGEWGTPFGMLVEHLLDIGESEAASELSVGDLNGFYRAARVKFDADETFKDRARKRVVLLQSGDEVTLRLWRTLVEESKKYFLTVYGMLGVRLTEDDFFGESYYNDQLQSVVDELDELGLLRESEGAQCVFPDGYTNRNGDPLPIIVKKGDGGFGYGATDLATIRHRLRNLKATRLLYVVGLPQRQHLGMIYDVAKDAGWLVPPARAEHVGHGSICGEDGKMLRTRAGVSVKLVDLLEEAVVRASAVIAEKNPQLDEKTRADVARAVGIGAVKYADLSTDRLKDYVFDYDRMLSFEGNTAPYLQYARARICSIFRKAGVEQPLTGVDKLVITEPAERALALELLQFDSLISEVAETLEFHKLANYLYGLASTFTSFYEKCPVLRSEGDVKQSRLVLCDITARTLELGLGLLGIDTPDQM